MTQRCKCASCEECGPGYRRRIGELAASGKPYSMLTFTAPPHKGRSPSAQARELLKHAAAFRRHWNKRRPKEAISWFWVLEAHKSGQPHMHVLVAGGFLPIRLLRSWMFKRMRAKFTYIDKVRDQTGASSYVTKYVTKLLDKFKGVARWGRSRGYGEKPTKRELFPELAHVRWERLLDKPAKIAHDYLMNGWRIDTKVKWCIVMRHPP